MALRNSSLQFILALFICSFSCFGTLTVINDSSIVYPKSIRDNKPYQKHLRFVGGIHESGRARCDLYPNRVQTLSTMRSKARVSATTQSPWRLNFGQLKLPAIERSAPSLIAVLQPFFMMSTGEEQILGTILYAADSPDYTLRSIVFTDKQVLQIPLSKMSELATRASGAPTTVAWLLEVANPATFYGLGGLVGMKTWGNFKSKVSDKPVVKLERGPLPGDMLDAAKSKLPYDEIKEVKLKKIMLSSDWLLSLGAGFLHSKKIVFDGRAVSDVKDLIMSTPLAPKLKE